MFMMLYSHIVVTIADLHIIEEWTIAIDQSLHSLTALVVGDYFQH